VFSKELIDLIVRVVTSWQVIAVTLAIVVYVAIVSNVARLYRSARPRPSEEKPGKGRKGKADAEDADVDELGLGD
jgi:hypothetical protein